MGIVARSDSADLLGAIRELAEYRRQDPVAVACNVGNSFHLVNEQWRTARPETPAEILGHYRTCEWQVEQQVFCTYGIPHQVELRQRVVERLKGGSDVLDLGAGIGSMLLPLRHRARHCVHADVAGPMSKYAAWRYGRGPRVEVVELSDDYIVADPRSLLQTVRAFDVVICTEVIEHVPEPERLVEFLARLVLPGGMVVATTSFHDDDGVIPMHLREHFGKYDD